MSRSRTLEAQRGTAAYWWCLLALVGLTFAASFASESEGGTVGLLLVVLLLPGHQLAAALIAAIVGFFLWGPEAMRRVGRLALRGFVGGLIGLGLMALPGFALNGSGVGAVLVGLGLCGIVWLCVVVKRRAQQA